MWEGRPRWGGGDEDEGFVIEMYSIAYEGDEQSPAANDRHSSDSTGICRTASTHVADPRLTRRTRQSI